MTHDSRVHAPSLGCGAAAREDASSVWRGRGKQRTHPATDEFPGQWLEQSGETATRARTARNKRHLLGKVGDMSGAEQAATHQMIA